MKFGLKKFIASFLTLATAFVTLTTFAGKNAIADGVSVSYKAYVQNIGWQDLVSDGAVAGTEGCGLRMEALAVVVSGDPELGVRYKTHVQNQGWDADWRYNGDGAGSVGMSYRMEALQIELTGAHAADYDIYYSLHVQNFGWLQWACNGQTSGTTGCGLRVEAVKILVVPKGGEAPASDSPYSHCPSDIMHVGYSSHVQDFGWTGDVMDGTTTGSVGCGKRLEGIRITAFGGADVGVRYRTHIQNIGWESDWKSNGELSGTEGQSLRLEAIQIELTGADAGSYDIWYRSHVQNYGWLGWAKNGEYSGSSSCGYRMEAVEIRILPRGSMAPGSTDSAYVTTPIFTDAMDQFAQGFSSDTPYLILVNKSTFTVAIYTRSNGYWTRIDSFPCTIGAPGHDTIEGVFRVGYKQYRFDSGSSRCFYATQFCGNFLIHSTLYNQLPGPTSPQDSRLGMALSHGCVRVALGNAEWIYNNIPRGTTVVVYH